VSEPAVSHDDDRERRAFEHLLEQVLTPLMPIAITYGMSANQLAWMTRAIYLRVIEERLQTERGHPISDARLALVSGLTRHDVDHVRKRMGARDSSRSELDEKLRRIAIVLSAWHTNPKFAGAYGMPLDLDLKSNGEESPRSFDALIKIACAELAVPVTLDELIAQGAVEVVHGDIVRCKARAALSDPKAGTGREGQLESYGHFLAAAVGTIAHNLRAEDSSKFYFDRLLRSDLPLSDRIGKQFFTRSLASTGTFLSELDSWLSKNAGESTEDSTLHYGVGVFFFADTSNENIAPVQGDFPQQDGV
jgi:Family of unknown function (DUF6502)